MASTFSLPAPGLSPVDLMANAQAAAKIDGAQLFIPIAAPVRWSLVSNRVQGFAGNRYARHTLTDLQQQPGSQ